MKLMIRVDDVAMSPREAAQVPDKLPDTGCEIVRRFHAAMGGLPYLAAVVPAMLDEAGGDWIRSRPPGMTVALHGWDHTRRGTVANEFHGLTVEEMRNKIADGYKIVGGCKWFVPPFNACEEGLFEACFHEGIRFVCGSPSKWPTPPQPWGVYREVTFVPAWAPLYGATAWSQGGGPVLLKEIARYINEPGVAVLTLHGPTWEFAKDQDFVGVRALVKAVGANVISPEEFARIER